MAARLRQLTTRGLVTAWLEDGPAGPTTGTPVLLFLHGFPDTAEMWSGQLSGLADRYTVVAPYGRGVGPSSPADRRARYAPDSVALDLLAVLAAVDPSGARPVVLIGHDLGTVHAWNLARFLCDRAAGLVLINGLTIAAMMRRLRRPRQLLRSWYMPLMQLPVLPELLAKAAPEPLLALAHWLGGLTRERRPPATAARDALAGPLNQYRVFLAEAPRRLRTVEPRLACPVLVLFGADDAFLLPPRADELAAAAADVTIRILPGNHWLHRTRPAQVNALIAELAEAAQARGRVA